MTPTPADDEVRPAGPATAPEITFGDIGRALWRKLREMRTAFQVLVLIAIATLICAVVPQHQPAEMYAQRYGPFLGNIIIRLGFDHVQTVPWFSLLIGILLVSLAACSRRLYQEGAGRWRIPDAAAAGLKVKGARALTRVVAVDLAAAVAGAQDALRHTGHQSVPLGQQDGRELVYLHKHRFSAWGSTAAHYAVFLIALGSILGTLPGLSLDQNVDIQEQATYHSETAPLPFDIKVDKFRIDRDPATGDVKNYFSEVSLLAQGKEVARKEISVNHPLQYQGYYISQASWGLGAALVEVTQNGHTQKLTYQLARGTCPGTEGMGDGGTTWGIPQENAAGFLPDGRSALVATDFFPDARRVGKQVQGRDVEYPGTPAINLTYVFGLPGQEKPSGPVSGPPKHGMKEVGFLLEGETASFEGGTVKFVGISKTTGLGIRKDVGLPLVYIGFISSILGLMLIFYFPTQRSIIAFEARGAGETALTIGTYGRTGDLTEDADDIWNAVAAKLPASASGSGKPAAQKGDSND